MHAARFPSRLQRPATWGCSRGRTAAAKPRGARLLRTASTPSAPAPSLLHASLSPSSTSTRSPSTSGWDARLASTFDWRRQWYPVGPGRHCSPRRRMRNPRPTESITTEQRLRFPTRLGMPLHSRYRETRVQLRASSLRGRGWARPRPPERWFRRRRRRVG